MSVELHLRSTTLHLFILISTSPASSFVSFRSFVSWASLVSLVLAVLSYVVRSSILLFRIYTHRCRTLLPCYLSLSRWTKSPKSSFSLAPSSRISRENLCVDYRHGTILGRHLRECGRERGIRLREYVVLSQDVPKRGGNDMS